MQSDVIGTSEAGRMLGVSRQTINRYIRDGKLRAVETPGGQARLRKSDVLALRVGATPFSSSGAVVIGVAQHKGGTGKTSTTLNLGAALAEQGYRVLLVDLDPQADLTAGLGLPVDERNDPSLYTALVNGDADLSGLVVTTDFYGMRLLPGTLDMADLELSIAAKMGREQVLRKALKSLVPNYDFILLDCPPSLGLITVNALLAAQAVLVPVKANPRSVRAIERVLGAVGLVRDTFDHDGLTVLGIVMTMTDATTLVSRETVATVRQFYGDLVMESEIPDRTKVAEDVLYKSPLLAFASRSDAADAYRHLATDVLNRLGVPALEVVRG